MSGNLLQVRQLEVVYNRVATAIQGVSLDVPAGSIVALVGTNGAGKTTTLRAISGFLPSEDAEITDGDVSFAGKRINGRLPHELARSGIILVPERDKVFATLDVRENLEFAARQGGEVTLDRILELFPASGRTPDAARRLSQRRREADARNRNGAPVPARPASDRRASLGLAPIAIKELMERLAQVSRELSLTVLLVEQNANAALAISDYGYVMEGGPRRAFRQGVGARYRIRTFVSSIWAVRTRRRRAIATSSNIAASGGGGADAARDSRSLLALRGSHGPQQRVA